MSDSKVEARKMNSTEVETQKSQTQSEETVDGREGSLDSEQTKKPVAAQPHTGNGQFHAEVEAFREKQRADTTELRGEINAVSEKQRTDKAELRGEMQTGFAQVRGEMQTGFAKLHAENMELRAENEKLHAERRVENEKLHAAYRELRAENEKLHAERHAETQGMIKSSHLSITKWFIATTISLGGLMMTLIGLLIAIEFFG